MLTITFNGQGSTAISNNQVNVQMRRDDFGSHRLALEMMGSLDAPTDLEPHLNNCLDQQTLALGCLPSTGYALVHGLWSRQKGVIVDGIWFNPSLARPADLAPRKPLPQTFHNWLGERRTTFQRWLTEPPRSWSWHLVEGVDNGATFVHSASGQRAISHFELLDALIESAKSGTIRELEAFTQASIQPSPELLQESAKNSALEQMFHLNRAQSETRNWWLFDTQASAMIEQIAQRLRLAQYLAFSRAALEQAKAD